MITERSRQKILRELGCIVPGCRNAEVDLHHVRTAANSGIGMKPSDAHCVGICHAHHTEGHQTGWASFQRKYGIDLAVEARILAQIDWEMP